MGYLASVVIEFGDTVTDTSAVAVVELDEVYNEEKTSFAPGDEPRICLHYDKNVYTLTSVTSSSGDIIGMGDEEREREEQVDFINIDDEVTLTYIPYGTLTFNNYGNEPEYSRADNILTCTGGSLPSTSDVTMQVQMGLYKLIPPAVELDEDETYRILTVFTLEEA